MTASYRFERFELQPERRLLLQDGRPVELGARAFDVLLTLVERRGELVTKAELLDRVWPGLVVEENNLQVQISTVRKLLGQQAVATLPGRGYRFAAALNDGDDANVGANASLSPMIGIHRNLPSVSPTNLPGELPVLFGRDEDLPILQAMIETHRLVTVVGAGGIGKTRLALAVAHELLATFQDGVWLVELASISDNAFLVTKVASALHITLGAEAQVENLVKTLAGSQALVVLDNCEHLLSGVSELAAALLRSTTGIRLLATSQEPLKIAHEHIYRLGTLLLPSEAGIDNARKSGAVCLFEARAKAADRHFAIDETNVDAVVSICRQLDGVALAIELAAARVPLLGIDDLSVRLRDCFRVLTGGDRLALRRHQTLRAAMEWSHDLLTADEQAVFRRLGVFVGSFSLYSAQYVAADTRIDEWAVLDLLGALVDKSLVVAEGSHEPRYRLLETTRAFALDKLRVAGNAEDCRRRHAEVLTTVFEVSRREEYILATQVRLMKYLPDLDNARAALDWLACAKDGNRLHVALAGAIAWIWVLAGLRPEGQLRTSAAMSRIGPEIPGELEAQLLGSWFALAHPKVGAQELAANARAIEIYRALGDRRRLYVAFCHQAKIQAHSRQLEEAELALREAEELFDESWAPAFRAPLLVARNWVRDNQARYEEGLESAEELLRLATAIDDQLFAVAALIELEQSAAALGRLEEAVACGYDLLSRIDHDHSMRRYKEPIVLHNLMMSLTRFGKLEEALEIGRRAYTSVKKAGRLQDLIGAGALLACKRGRIEDAARMAGCAASSIAASEIQRDPVDQIVHDELMENLRTAVSSSELTRLMQHGQMLSDDEAVRLALW